MKRSAPRTTARVRLYAVVERAVAEGVTYGWRRAHKHTDAPSADTIQEEIGRAVMGAIDEVIDWGDP